jgi:MYXO-CTERM domain-containing protein
MRPTWLSIAACAILLCWAAQTPSATAPGKPPPCEPCNEPPPDAGDQDAATEVDGGADAAPLDSGGGTTTPDAATALDAGDVAGPTAGSSGCGCELVGKRPDPAAGLALLILAALIAGRLRRSKRTES